MSFYSLSNVPDSNRAAKGQLRVFLFILKISSKSWWFLWIILKSCEGIELAEGVLQKKHTINLPGYYEAWLDPIFNSSF